MLSKEGDRQSYLMTEAMEEAKATFQEGGKPFGAILVRDGKIISRGRNRTVQTGDPTATGAGGPGYTIPDELSPDRRHDGPGVLSMANSGFGTGGSQFFITHTATPHLDGYEPDGSPKPCEIPVISCHAVFGRVIEGLDVVNSIQGPDSSSGSEFGDRLIAVEIREK